MNIKKEMITINNYKGDHLGIQVIFAANSKTNQNYAIISDVNPAGYCFPENITAGDILVSVNGMEIKTLDSLNDVNNFLTEERNIVIEIQIIRKGALDGSDLIKRCLNSPCSEFCQMWNESEVKFKKKIEIPDKLILSNDIPPYSLKYSKATSVDEVQLKQQKISTVSNEESKLSVSSTKSKIIYHQKAVPMKPMKKNGESNVKRKLNQSPNRDMIASPAPHFIHRPSARSYDKATPPQLPLKQAKSLSNLSHISDDSQTSSATESTSTASSPSPIFAPRKTSLPTTEIPYKPTPKPRSKHLTHQRSIEPQQFFSINPMSEKRHEAIRPLNANSKPSPKRFNHVPNQDVRQEPKSTECSITSSKSADPCLQFQSLPVFHPR